VKVKVERGWVTLSGEVDWQCQRLSAADSIRDLLGVISVSNQFAIKPQVTAKAVKADIEVALKRGAAADAKQISVDIKGADITLAGTVRS